MFTLKMCCKGSYPVCTVRIFRVFKSSLLKYPLAIGIAFHCCGCWASVRRPHLRCLFYVLTCIASIGVHDLQGKVETQPAVDGVVTSWEVLHCAFEAIVTVGMYCSSGLRKS